MHLEYGGLTLRLQILDQLKQQSTLVLFVLHRLSQII